MFVNKSILLLIALVALVGVQSSQQAEIPESAVTGSVENVEPEVTTEAAAEAEASEEKQAAPEATTQAAEEETAAPEATTTTEASKEPEVETTTTEATSTSSPKPKKDCQKESSSLDVCDTCCHENNETGILQKRNGGMICRCAPLN